MESNEITATEENISQPTLENSTVKEVPSEPPIPVEETTAFISTAPKKSLFKNKKLIKKLIVIASLLFAIIIISLISNALNKSDEAKAVDALIKQIGVVSLEDGDSKIVAAEEAVDDLLPEHRKELDRLDKLEKARATYNKLLKESKIEAIEDAINAIGSVNLKSGKAIKKARKAYDDSETDIKTAISNYEILEKAEASISSLRVNQVIELINKIGTVTLKSGSAIDAADEIYEELSDSDKKKITNYAKLSEAKATFKKLKAAEKEKKIKSALAVFNKSHDKVTGSTFYMPKSFPRYIDTRCYIIPYIGENSGEYWLRLRLNYTGDDWIFWTKLTFLVDGERYYQSVSYYDITRDNNRGVVWEYYDYNPLANDILLLKKIASSKETIIRFEGSSYHYDLKVTAQDKATIKQVLDAYTIIIVD